jgi:hypothetical protein
LDHLGHLSPGAHCGMVGIKQIDHDQLSIFDGLDECDGENKIPHPQVKMTLGTFELGFAQICIDIHSILKVLLDLWRSDSDIRTLVDVFIMIFISRVHKFKPSTLTHLSP